MRRTAMPERPEGWASAWRPAAPEPPTWSRDRYRVHGFHPGGRDHGNVNLPSLGKDSFQEVDIAGVTMPITKHGYIVKDVRILADTIRRRFRSPRQDARDRCWWM